MSNINFRPWVGTKYETEGFHGKKILVLGESHYCPIELAKGGRCHPLCKLENMNEKCYSQTEDNVDAVIYDYEGTGDQQTFLVFERAVLGKVATQEEREDFWESIVFYNYCQYSQAEANTAPQPEHWELSVEGFREVLEKYLPDYIIVWGDRLYENLPNWGGKDSILTISNTDTTKVFTYNINGKEIPAMMVYHPCRGKGRSWTYWHQFYVKFLGLPE